MQWIDAFSPVILQFCINCSFKIFPRPVILLIFRFAIRFSLLLFDFLSLNHFCQAVLPGGIWLSRRILFFATSQEISSLLNHRCVHRFNLLYHYLFWQLNIIFVMTEQSNQIDPRDLASFALSSSKSPLSEDDHCDLAANLNLRLDDLERRVQHLEKVIQRQIRLGRMVQ